MPLRRDGKQAGSRLALAITCNGEAAEAFRGGDDNKMARETPQVQTRGRAVEVGRGSESEAYDGARKGRRYGQLIEQTAHQYLPPT